MDLLSRLPLEISQEILTYLDAQEVGRCCFVCKKWREIANYNFVWYKLCSANGIDVKEEVDCGPNNIEVTLLDPQCKWARIFNVYFSTLISNWSSSNCERFDIPYREQTHAHVVPRVYTDGKTIALGDCNGVIDVWRIKQGRKSQPSLFQSFTIPRHTVTKVLTNSDYLIAVIDTIYIAVYELKREGYELLSCFFTKTFPSRVNNKIDRFVYKKDSQSLTNFIETRTTSTLMVHTVGLFGQCFYLRTSVSAVFVWCLKPFGYSGEINFFRQDCTATSFGDYLYVHFRSKIEVYDSHCRVVKVYRVRRNTGRYMNQYISSLSCNGSLVSAISGDYRDLKEVSRKLIIWDMESAREISSKELLMYKYAFLHPKMDIVYIVHQYNGPKYMIKAWRPRDSDYSWISFHISGLDSYHFSTVGSRFIIFFTHLDNNYFIFDSKTGQKKPLIINGNDSSIIHYSNNSFILAECRTQRIFTIFSFIN